MDGERPLECSSWKSVPSALLTLLSDFNFLKAFHKRNHYEFNPNTEKSADIVLYVFSTRCPFGASYEVGSPEDADTMPPEGYYALLEEPCLN